MYVLVTIVGGGRHRSGRYVLQALYVDFFGEVGSDYWLHVVIYNDDLSHSVGSIATGINSPPFTGKGEFVHTGAVGCKLAVLNSYVLITIVGSGDGGYSRDVLRTADIGVGYAAYQDRDGVILNMDGLSHLVAVATGVSEYPFTDDGRVTG